MNELLHADLRSVPEAFHRSLRTARSSKPTAINGRRVVTTGSGDSLFAARLLAGPLRRALAVDLRPEYPLAMTTQRDLSEDDVVVCISFSGSAQRTIAAAKRSRDAGAHVIALTANPSAELTGVSDEVVPIDWLSHGRGLPHCADHMATMAALIACAEGLAGREADLSATSQLAQFSDKWERQAQNYARMTSDAQWVFFLAPGEKVALAEYAAAKLWESAGQRAAAFEMEEFGHGPHLIVSAADAIVLLACDHAVDDAVRSAIEWSSRCGAASLAVKTHLGADESRASAGLAQAVLDHVPVQWLTYWLAEERGVDVTSGPPRLQQKGGR
jgi:fructoselysine-6-P-deglycase FrlB-like protein